MPEGRKCGRGEIGGGGRGWYDDCVMKVHTERQLGLVRGGRTVPAARGMVLAGVAAGLAMLAGVSGCAKPLLSPDEERTPFDRYDGIRAQYAPQYTTDEYGMKKPNLRSRLSGKD